MLKTKRRLRAENIMLIARKFSELLHRDCTSAEIKRINALNKRRRDKSICATHEFLDANETMAEAFKAIMFYDAEPESESDCEIWNRAWTLAKNNQFTVNSESYAK